MRPTETYPGACFDCGGAVTVTHETSPDGICENCGPVGVDVIDKDGKPHEGFSVSSWVLLEKQRAESKNEVPGLDPDDIPF